LQRNPPGSGQLRAHVACGANLALESVGDFREDQSAKIDFPGSPGMQTRRFGGFCISGSGVAVLRD
jgi:hypothetical protein